MRGWAGSEGAGKPVFPAAMPLVLPVALLLGHGAALALAGSGAMLWSIAFLIAIPSLACIACLMRGVRGTSGGWFALGAAMLCWSGGMAATMASRLELGLGDPDGLSMLLYVLYGVPLIFALASPEGEDWKVRLVDGALATALGYLFFVYVSRLTASGTTLLNYDALRFMFDVENGYIAVFAIIRWLACADRRQVAFFRALAVYASLYCVTAAYINHVHSDTDFGFAPDLIIDLPFLLLLGLAAADGRLGVAANPPLFPRVVRAASPLLIPATLLTTSALLLRFDPGLAITGSAAAMIGYGLRTVLAQVRSFEERERLEQLSHADPLTGVPNRRQFEDMLRREWARLGRDGGHLALAMIDIDHFKQLNDHFGHAEGDARLKAVAAALTGCARRGTDLVARYGGEEFVAVLPGIEAERATALADMMRRAVEALALPSPAGAGVVTVSVGIAHVDRAAGEALALLERADAALYRSKATGRNRVTLAPPPTVEPVSIVAMRASEA